MWANRRLAFVMFAAAVALQVLIVAVVPVRKIMTLRNGKPVTLRVEPVDPYSILSGYYVTLGYDVSLKGRFPKVEPELKEDEVVYAVIAKGPDGVFKPVRLSRERPGSLDPDQLFLKGRTEGWVGAPIDYGISQFYIPESRRDEISAALTEELWREVPRGRDTTETLALRAALRAAGDDEITTARSRIFPDRERRENSQVFVDARVDADGNAALETLRIRDRVYKAE